MRWTPLLLLTACGLLGKSEPDEEEHEDDEIEDSAADSGGEDSGGDSGEDSGDCIGDAFADSPNGWTLPSGYGTGAFVATAGTMDCATDAPSFVTTDLTGDGKPDLVVTRACDDAGVGTTHWRVHAGGVGGFADSPTTWSLPSGYGTGAFVATAGTMDCATDAPSFTLADLDGDDAAELIVTRTCDDATVGTSTWRVHANTGTGFGGAGGWSLPGGYGDHAFIATSGAMDCADDAPSFFLSDLDGDATADIVVTQACDDATVGTDTWRLHAGAGSGFGAGTDWTLPDGYGDAAFTSAASGMACASLRPAHTLASLDDDHRADLVVTQACDDTTVGVSKWRRYPNTGSGFGAAETWTLPGDYGSQPFPATSGTMSCATGQPTFQVATLEVGGTPELLVTRACDESDVGTGAWRLHAGQASGFGAATSWGLPSGYGAGAFIATAGVMDCATDAPSFVTSDMDGGGWADLVVTRSCDDASVGTTTWRLHVGECGD